MKKTPLPLILSRGRRMVAALGHQTLTGTVQQPHEQKRKATSFSHLLMKPVEEGPAEDDESNMVNLLNDSSARENLDKPLLCSDTSTHAPRTSQLEVESHFQEVPSYLVTHGQSYMKVPVFDCPNNEQNETDLNCNQSRDCSRTDIMISNCDEVPSDSESYLTVSGIDSNNNGRNEIDVNVIPSSSDSSHTHNITILNCDDLPDNGQYEMVVIDGVVGAEDALTEFLVFGNSDSKVDGTLEQTSVCLNNTAVAGPSCINDLDEARIDLRDPDYTPSLSECSSDEFDMTPSGYVDTVGPAPRAKESDTNIECARKRRGRKRKHDGQCHDNVKCLKNSNKTYYNSKGSLVPAKVWYDAQCTCNAECHTRLEANTRREIFKEFWDLAEYSAENLFIAACIKETPIAAENHRGGGVVKREFSRVYTLKNQEICREMFRKTLQISTKRINTAMRKFRSGDLRDKRGSKQGGQNKITDEQLAEVTSHINRLPRYKSHYRRRDTDAEFLPVNMTLAKMYDLYLQEKFGETSELLKSWKKEKNVPTKKAIAAQVGGVVSSSTYRRIFFTHFNLKFKTLKKDTCNLCDSLAARLASATTEEEKRALEEEQALHQELWQKARQLMKQDQELAAAKLENVETLTFDLEKTLPLPRIPTSIVFYKRQLWLYNAGVHSCRNKQGYCYVWTENMAGRGAQEIGSCLMKHIENQVGPEVRHLLLWSDSCGGQNRNIKMVLMLKCCLESHPSLETIKLKFLVSGHSFLPNDTDFSDIESALSHVQRLYLPEDYVNVMKSARKKKPFVVTQMASQDFKGTQKLEGKITNRKHGASNEKINWLKIREIKIEKKDPYAIYTRSDFESEYSVINLEKKTARGKKPSCEGTTFFQENLEPMWQNGKPIAAPKLKDLKSLMHLLTKEAKPFYNSLEGSRAVEDDIDGFGAPIDFDVEDE